MSTPNTHFGAKKIGEYLEKCKKVFFIGIGGVNMSSLALITKERGFEVAGSDRESTAVTRHIEENSIKVWYSHSAEHIEGFDALVYTVAISPDNPEYTAAQEAGIMCISRADYLGYIMTGYKNRIGVSGMHGKSTCTSMCAQVFMDADVDPTVLSGAELPSMGGAFRIGEKEHFIFEACEYMDSFLDFNPTIAIVLNIERDHVDYFHSMAQIYESYAKFTAITGDNGYAVMNIDDANVVAALSDYAGTKITFSTKNRNADLFADNITYKNGKASFDILRDQELMCKVSLSVPGEHNIYNALAAAAAATLCSIPPDKIAVGLRNFTGAVRRTEYKGKINGADIYDDYGHHPTEVKTTLKGLRNMGYKKITCVFQPHTYTRTKELFDGFAEALQEADTAVIYKIYPARETDTLGVSSEMLAERIGEEKGVYLGSFSEISEYIKENARDGEAVMIMGAGDICSLFDCLKFD